MRIERSSWRSRSMYIYYYLLCGNSYNSHDVGFWTSCPRLGFVGFRESTRQAMSLSRLQIACYRRISRLVWKQSSTTLGIKHSLRQIRYFCLTYFSSHRLDRFQLRKPEIFCILAKNWQKCLIVHVLSSTSGCVHVVIGIKCWYSPAQENDSIVKSVSQQDLVRQEWIQMCLEKAFIIYFNISDLVCKFAQRMMDLYSGWWMGSRNE